MVSKAGASGAGGKSTVGGLRTGAGGEPTVGGEGTGAGGGGPAGTGHWNGQGNQHQMVGRVSNVRWDTMVLSLFVLPSLECIGMMLTHCLSI